MGLGVLQSEHSLGSPPAALLGGRPQHLRGAVPSRGHCSPDGGLYPGLTGCPGSAGRRVPPGPSWRARWDFSPRASRASGFPAVEGERPPTPGLWEGQWGRRMSNWGVPHVKLGSAVCALVFIHGIALAGSSSAAERGPPCLVVGSPELGPQGWASRFLI